MNIPKIEDIKKQKKDMLHFLQKVNYQEYKKRINQTFSNPIEYLKQVKEEIDSLEDIITRFRETNRIPLPYLDNPTNVFIDKAQEIIRGFNEQAEEIYKKTIDKFLEEYNQTKKEKENSLQKRILKLRRLSEEYNLFRESGGFPKNERIQDYYQFHSMLGSIDTKVSNLLNEYKEIKTIKDFEKIKKIFERIKTDFKDIKRNKKTFCGLSKEFRYQNQELNTLEKELDLGLLPIKLKIIRDITAIEQDIDITQRGNLTKIKPPKIRYHKYANTLLLSDLIKQYYSSADKLKRITKAVYPITKKCDEIKKSLREGEITSLRTLRKNSFTHLDSTPFCKKHLEEYTFLLSQAEKMISEYNKEQKRRTEERQKIKYEPQKDPAQSKKTDLNEFSLTLYIDALGLPENEDFFKFAHILKGESGDGWLQRFERFTKYLSQIKPSLKQKDRRYLLKLKKGIENSLNASYVLNELKGDKDYKEGVNRMSKQINSYLSTCENLAA